MTDSTTETDVDRWLRPTEFLDHDHPDVQAFARDAVGDVTDPVDQAVRLFYRVRDGFWYNPYSSSRDRDEFRASHIVRQPEAWCVPKSIVLTAAARSAGIPARLGYADVRNHLQSEKLKEKMGTDLFIFHGYSELLLEDRWVKASSAFNIELCERFGTRPLEFDGRSDALLHEHDTSGNRHMEYVRQRGSYDDFPYEEMVAAFEELYGPDDLDDGDTDEAFQAPA